MNVGTVRRGISAVACSGLVLGAAACGGVRGAEAEDGKLDFKFATYVTENTTESKVARWWFERSDELAADHEIDIEYFYGGSLIPPEDTLSGVADGRAETAVYTVLYNPAELPLSQIVTVPFMSQSGEAVARTATDLYENNPDFRAEFDRQGVVPLLWAMVPNTTVGFNERVSSIDDFDGKKVRAVGYIAQALEALGVESVGLPAPETYEALQTGVLDGFASLAFNNAVNSFRVSEVAPHFVDSGMGQYVLSAQVLMDADVWDGLPDEVQDAMQDAAVEALDENVKLQAEEGVQACKTFNEAGGTITSLPADDIETWKAEVQAPALEEWAATAVKSGLDKQAVADFRDQWIAGLEKYSADAEPDVFTACKEG